MSENLPIDAQVSDEANAGQTLVSARFSATYVGAVPPPDVLAAYESYVPGAAEPLTSKGAVSK